jgi:hypothetical protein
LGRKTDFVSRRAFKSWKDFVVSEDLEDLGDFMTPPLLSKKFKKT